MAIIPGGDGRAKRRASAKPAASQTGQGTQLDCPTPRLVVLRSAATHQLCGARGALLADALGQAGAAGKRAVRVSVRVRVMARYHRASGCHRRGSILVRRVSRVVEVVGVVEASREWSHSKCRRHTSAHHTLYYYGRRGASSPILRGRPGQACSASQYSVCGPTARMAATSTQHTAPMMVSLALNLALAHS